ncbi:endonuclease/exonuclease/phosphatase family protein [Streptococcus dentiloxodontae]
MMKCLTLNVHSWLEDNQQQKFDSLLQHLLTEDYDMICLQEINQLISCKAVTAPLNYLALDINPDIHEDNYALLLVEELAQRGHNYYWSWAYNHIGYGKYHEGVAILSKDSFTPEAVLISNEDDETDYHTRRSLVAKFNKQFSLTAVSLHLSWWNKGFQSEWQRLSDYLEKAGEPLILMGDFNNPTDKEGYQAILSSQLRLKDSHTAAKIITGDYTIADDIDGWEGNQNRLKVDHAFLSKKLQIQSSEVVLDNNRYPAVSDHFGLAVCFDLEGS